MEPLSVGKYGSGSTSANVASGMAAPSLNLALAIEKADMNAKAAWQLCDRLGTLLDKIGPSALSAEAPKVGAPPPPSALPHLHWILGEQDAAQAAAVVLLARLEELIG